MPQLHHKSDYKGPGVRPRAFVYAPYLVTLGEVGSSAKLRATDGAVEFAAEGLPSGVELDSATGVLRRTGYAFVGSVRVGVSARNGAGWSSSWLVLTCLAEVVVPPPEGGGGGVEGDASVVIAHMVRPDVFDGWGDLMSDQLVGVHRVTGNPVVVRLKSGLPITNHASGDVGFYPNPQVNVGPSEEGVLGASNQYGFSSGDQVMYGFYEYDPADGTTTLLGQVSRQAYMLSPEAYPEYDYWYLYPNSYLVYRAYGFISDGVSFSYTENLLWHATALAPIFTTHGRFGAGATVTLSRDRVRVDSFGVAIPQPSQSVPELFAPSYNYWNISNLLSEGGLRLMTEAGSVVHSSYTSLGGTYPSLEKCVADPDGSRVVYYTQ